MIIIVIKDEVTICFRPRKRPFNWQRTKGRRKPNNEGRGEKETEDFTSSSPLEQQASSMNESGWFPAHNYICLPFLALQFSSFHCQWFFGEQHYTVRSKTYSYGII